jgi:mRNA-degrading endonuclease RelE of RelBE toxin-antitoxin system
MLSNKTYKFLANLDGKTRKRVMADLESLAYYPFWDRSLDIAMFEGEKHQYRLRTGKLRTVFKIDQDAETILVQKIGYRENVYE